LPAENYACRWNAGENEPLRKGEKLFLRLCLRLVATSATDALAIERRAALRTTAVFLLQHKLGAGAGFHGRLAWFLDDSADNGQNRKYGGRRRNPQI